MLIKPDEIHKRVIDTFTSTSGKYQFILTSRLEGKWEGFYIIVLRGGKVARILRMGGADVAAPYPARKAFYAQWEYIRSIMTAPAKEEEPSMLQDLLAQQDYEDKGGEMKTKPRGARIFIKPIIPVDEVTARAQAAGLEVVIDESRKPRASMGVVMAVGEDPLAQELYKEGDVVVFSPHAGVEIREDGYVYRSLELHEIIGVRDSSESLG